MISFRFHLVSLVAVFLAIALGIVMGSTVVQESIVDGLRDQIKRVSAESEDVTAQNDALRAELDQTRTALAAASPYAGENRLAGDEVVVVAERGADAVAVRDFVDLAAQAGADVPGIVWLEPAIVLADADVRSQAAALVGLGPDSTADDVRAAVYGAVAARFAGDAPGGEADPLDGLRNLGLVSTEVVADGDFAAFPVGTPTVVTAGAAAIDPDPVDLFDVATAFDAASLPALAAEVWSDQPGNAPRGNAVFRIIGDVLGDRVATVDDLDLQAGRLAAVIAIAQLGEGTVGHYGLGAGAGSAFPEWTEG